MNAIEQAGVIYPMLVEAARDRSTITYGQVNNALGYKPNATGQAIRSGMDLLVLYCLENDLPKITSLIVNKNSGLPTEGYAYGTGENIPVEHSACFDHQWDRVIDYSGIWDSRVELRRKHNIGQS
jgi:hypothetical protein